MCADQGTRQNGATSGATLESCRGKTRLNARLAADWEVMIEHVMPLHGVS